MPRAARARYSCLHPHAYLPPSFFFCFKLATAFWVDVRSVFGNVGKSRTFATPYRSCVRSFASLAPDSALRRQGQMEPHEVLSDFIHTGEAISPRFDWRTRASVVKRKKQKYVRRVDPEATTARPGDLFFSEINTYEERCAASSCTLTQPEIFLRFLPLLAAEQEEQEAVIRERLSTWSVERLQQEGYCITGMSAYWIESKRFGRPEAAFSLGPGVQLPSNGRFECASLYARLVFGTHRAYRKGTQVLVTHLDPIKEVPRRGSVLSCTATHIRVIFNESFDLNEEDGIWRCVPAFAYVVL